MTLTLIVPPIVQRLFNPAPDYVIDELMEKLPDFKKGYLDTGLATEEYDDFGPLVKFRDAFISYWNPVLDYIKKRRAELN